MILWGRCNLQNNSQGSPQGDPLEGVQEAHRQRLALFGGSFNPVHQAHLEVIQGVLGRGDISHVIAIPVNRSPFKEGEELLPGDLRLRMLRAALKGWPGVSVSDLELRRPPPSYTIHTVEQMARRYPRDGLCLVMGADTVAAFADWFLAGHILRKASLLLVGRPDSGQPLADDPSSWRIFLPEEWRSAVHARDGALWDDRERLLVERMPLRVAAVSSTRIRQERRMEQVPPAARELLEAHLAAQSKGSTEDPAGRIR